MEALTALAILRALRFDPRLARLRDVLSLVLTALLAPLVGTSITAALYLWQGHGAAVVAELWQEWWRMNTLGVLVAAPPILVWLTGPVRLPSRRTLLELLIGLALLLLFLQVLVVQAPGGQLGMVVSYLSLVAVIYSAVRFGPRGAASASLLLSLVAVLGTAHGLGPFVTAGNDVRELVLQVFVVVLTVVPLMLGAVIAEREHAIAARAHGERLLQQESRILEQVATGRPTSEVLAELVGSIERMSDGGLCSVLLLEGRRVHVAAAPSLPPGFNAAIEGLEIGPEAGSCGSAAYHNRTVIVSDIEHDPLWLKYRDLARPYGLKACWSVPIRHGADEVLGTFAVYYRDTRSPIDAELTLVERAASLAGIAIQRERREGLLASINRNLNEGLYRSTPERGMLYVNQAFARMFGYLTPEEVLTRGSPMLYADPARQEELERMIATHGRLINEEVRFLRRDGTPFWGLLSSTAVRGDDGALQYYDGAVSDITARKQLEEQLRQAQKMEAVGRLAGGVAHDFNNLLTAIGGYAHELLAGLPPDSTAWSDAREIIGAAERAAGLTRQLLAYSRQQLLTPQVLDLRQVVEDLSVLLRRLIGEDIRLLTDCTGDAFVRVDRGQLEQVLLNLVLNARDAMPQGGTLRVSTSLVELDAAFTRTHVGAVPGTCVCLTVQDGGMGMDAATRDRAFDPFFTTKEMGKGTGLGLSTVYGIVKQSGGYIWLDTSPGAGTTVRLYLPWVAERPTVEPGIVEHPPEKAGGVVLVVEDEQIVRDLVSRTLRGAGYEVLEAADGVAALALVGQRAGPIDLLLTDVIMPRMGGRELAGQLAARLPGLKLLFVSGYTEDAIDPRRGLEPGAAYLQKPFTPAALLERVRKLFANERVRL